MPGTCSLPLCNTATHGRAPFAGVWAVMGGRVPTVCVRVVCMQCALGARDVLRRCAGRASCGRRVGTQWAPWAASAQAAHGVRALCMSCFRAPLV